MLKRFSNREKALLVVLALAAVWVLWYLSKQDDATGGGGGKEGEEAALALQAPVVRMDLLAGLAEDYDIRGRDLFQYSKRPPTQAELDRARRQQELVEKKRDEAKAAREARANRPPPTPTPTGPRPPRMTFDYLGKVGPKDDLHAVFVDGDDIMIARVGETVRKDFKVLEIDFQSVVMGYTDPRFDSRTETLTMSNK